ncbi:NAD-dependent succinate-semialdehyde dehydrogenase [Sphingorhabdus lutea]|uniref:NAD-dependent succinate-semialdehyde dehydrogenase n=1 Tax=Sphingorhabdus lutea TaxID=1913578 RepID=A0A1L3J9V4_9SPHN|nr:NAD-dependent succinate-semialdehyde dehydrogenase [Sphingorhabdus lutea]APG61900.1 NAD-dependent succinate-semialdehyde dehydrogenase [Sphingorhabdus lutea]
MTTPNYPQNLQLYINGAWHGKEGRETIPVINPATGEALADLPLATKADLDAALEAANKGFYKWRAVDVNERGAKLHKVADLIRERTDHIAALLTMEQGKPIAEAKGEVASCAGTFDYFAEEAKRIYGRVLMRPTGQRAMVLKQPVGPVAAFSPWNFPVSLMSKKMAAALAAGCSIIAKPPEETPASTIAIMQCVVDAGIPGDAAQLVYGVPDMVSRHLIASPTIRKISFTGSVPVGKHLLKLCADGVKRTTMELGGHAPVLIFDDCDLDRAITMASMTKFRNAGQICISPTRFYVQEGIYDAFAKGFAERTAQIKVGNGLDIDNAMGPLANSRRPDAIEALVEDARTKGANILTGGERGNSSGTNDGNFYKPTIIKDVPMDADIMSNEPFGPVALIRPFKTFDEAIEQANRLPFGLAGYAFTENGRQANMVADALEVGMVGLNSFVISTADAPFGGVKESGFGSEGGPEGLESYLVTKAVHQY